LQLCAMLLVRTDAAESEVRELVVREDHLMV
jgi:hypothetical protein